MTPNKRVVNPLCAHGHSNWKVTKSGRRYCATCMKAQVKRWRKRQAGN